MLQDQRIWLLISLKLSGEASAEELDELERFLNTNPDLTEKVEMLQELWKKIGRAVSQTRRRCF